MAARVPAGARGPGKRRKGPLVWGALPAWCSGGVLLSRGDSPQVPSALASLTSVFGMGTGVTSLLWPPEIWLSTGGPPLVGVFL